MIQFGGGERPRNLGVLAQAFVDPRGSDNFSAIDSGQEEAGNQIAAISSKIGFGGRVPFSFSVEYAGESISENQDYQLENTALTAGVYFPFFFSENVSLTYEYADWENDWYVNRLYSEDYTIERFVLGHWAMQMQHNAGTAVAGSSHFAKAQWQMPSDNIVSALVRVSGHENTADVTYQQAWELDVEYIVPLRSYIVSFGAQVGEDNLGEAFNRLKLSLDW